jgi:hypothetical protein
MKKKRKLYFKEERSSCILQKISKRSKFEKTLSLAKKSAQLFFSLRVWQIVVLLDVLNQHDINMIIDNETFYEIDAMEKFRVANQLINTPFDILFLLHSLWF